MLLSFALALAGCGGGREAPGRPLTKAELVAQASRICSEAGGAQERLERLSALRPPAEDQELFDGLLRAERAHVEAAENLREARKQGDSENAETDRLRITVNEGKASGYAHRLGVEACR